MRLFFASALILALISRTGVPLTALPRYFAGSITQFTSFFLQLQNEKSENDPFGALEGNIVDPEGKPVYAIEVSLIPVNKSNDERWYGTYRKWTNKEGRYEFKRVTPGHYVLGAHAEGAPDGKLPFATMYYPEAREEALATVLSIEKSKISQLTLMRLRRVETAIIKVHVVWQDGSQVARSNLLFHNLSYPDQAVIGDEAPFINGGELQFVVPKGFEYYARAKVDCDAGKTIETIESRPVQRIKVADGFTPQEMTFVIPSLPCKFWEPK
ncbi:MAG TPA: carboxypeptidase-like regulatory domain-containing protein [Candidatus Angelobacter sp.]